MKYNANIPACIYTWIPYTLHLCGCVGTDDTSVFLHIIPFLYAVCKRKYQRSRPALAIQLPVTSLCPRILQNIELHATTQPQLDHSYICMLFYSLFFFLLWCKCVIYLFFFYYCWLCIIIVNNSAAFNFADLAVFAVCSFRFSFSCVDGIEPRRSIGSRRPFVAWLCNIVVVCSLIMYMYVCIMHILCTYITQTQPSFFSLRNFCSLLQYSMWILRAGCIENYIIFLHGCL